MSVMRVSSLDLVLKTYADEKHLDVTKAKISRDSQVILAKTEERAKGLEPSTSSLGSSDGVVLSPANKRVAARRGKRCTSRCTSTRQEGAVSAGDGKPPVSDAAARTAGKQHPVIQDLAARLASLPPEAIAALQALFGGPPERPKNSG